MNLKTLHAHQIVPKDMVLYGPTTTTKQEHLLPLICPTNHNQHTKALEFVTMFIAMHNNKQHNVGMKTYIDIALFTPAAHVKSVI